MNINKFRLIEELSFINLLNIGYNHLKTKLKKKSTIKFSRDNILF